MVLPRALTTERLRLEATVPAHADGIWKATEVSLNELRPWMPWAADASRENSVGFTTLAEQRWAAALEWSFTIFHDDQIVGCISVIRYQPAREMAELGYWVRSDVGGRGYATEAGAALVRFGFDDLGLHRLEIHCGKENLPSIRVAEKLGFAREGEMRQAHRGAEGWYDSYLYARLATDR